MNKYTAVLLIVIGLVMFLFFLNRIININFSKEWLTAMAGIIAACLMFVFLFVKQQKRKS